MRLIPTLATLALSLPAAAQTVVGNSTLLGPAEAAQIAGWLGGGNEVRLTMVFENDSSLGRSSSDFHNACNGIGPTISVIHETTTGNVIGGYNPQSWHSGSSYIHGNDGWIFNLTSDVRMEQVLTWQTYNHNGYGPTFGGGHDIYMQGGLLAGYVNAHSYGPNNPGSFNILGNQGFTSTTYNRLEVFTISFDNIGSNYCSAVPNSTGLTGSIGASGSTTVTDQDFHLWADGMPTGEFGYFLNSPTQGFVSNPGGSAGNLCLGGLIGRHSASIAQTSGDGYLGIQVDLNALPRPMGQPPIIAVQPGETWNFQCWHRDGSSSNFTDGLTVTFN